MVPDSSISDNNRILIAVLAQYVTNFCHKIVHCLFSTWHKDLRKKRNCNFVLMCHMSGRLCFIISCGYNKRSSTIRYIFTLIVPDVYILPDTGIVRGIYIYFLVLL